MKRLILLLVATAPLFAQPTCVSIADTIYTLGTITPARMNGTIDLSIGYSEIDGSFTVVESTGRQTVTNGGLSPCLVPGYYSASYAVRKPAPLTGTSTFTRYWVIPTGATGPYALTSVPTGVVNVSGVTVTWQSGITFGKVSAGDTVLLAGAPSEVASVDSLTSLTLKSPATTQSGISFSDGPIERQTFAAPLPATIAGPPGAGIPTIPSSGALCLKALNFVAFWDTSCDSGGGALSLATLTDAQLLSLTDAQLLGMTN